MAIAMSGTGDVLHPHHFNLSNESSRLAAAGAAAGALVPRSVAVPEAGLDFDYTTGNIERQILEDALRKTNGNKAAAARILGLKRTTLAAKLKSLGATAG
jgi:DNA-binding NtrC family response regulator